MISFPLSVLLIPYAVIVAVILFFVFINIKNLARYRAEDVISFGALLIFLIGFAILGYFSCQYLSSINWTEQISMTLPSIKVGL
ncbi:MAG: hypothetical protein COU51_01700 [Parcubacteria group bacterium CG10_big_fil_rev_8_21_14_0_10_36_14]|nr:MAG: hypothetical protein COU51_01700 [Parcubacteria group bacterium CG10_big_fil_rev_8_21_14_0_10_36_14]